MKMSERQKKIVAQNNKNVLFNKINMENEGKRKTKKE